MLTARYPLQGMGPIGQRHTHFWTKGRSDPNVLTTRLYVETIGYWPHQSGEKGDLICKILSSDINCKSQSSTKTWGWGERINGFQPSFIIFFLGFNSLQFMGASFCHFSCFCLILSHPGSKVSSQHHSSQLIGGGVGIPWAKYRRKKIPMCSL